MPIHRLLGGRAIVIDQRGEDYLVVINGKQIDRAEVRTEHLKDRDLRLQPGDQPGQAAILGCIYKELVELAIDLQPVIAGIRVGLFDFLARLR